ncbi:MAG: HAD hydrolase family protein [Bacteroidota bacterium]
MTDIRLFATDIDGVWTDGSMYYDQTGNELKRFHTYDSAGVLFLRQLDVPVAIITGEDTEIVRRRAAKLKIPYVYQGIRDKVGTLDALRQELALDWSQIAYLGDDINDILLLEKVGLSACPANAPTYVQTRVDWPLDVRGGDGAFRAFVERYLTEKGLLDQCLEQYLHHHQQKLNQ